METSGPGPTPKSESCGGWLIETERGAQHGEPTPVAARHAVACCGLCFYPKVRMGAAKCVKGTTHIPVHRCSRVPSSCPPPLGCEGASTSSGVTLVRETCNENKCQTDFQTRQESSRRRPAPSHTHTGTPTRPLPRTGNARCCLPPPIHVQLTPPRTLAGPPPPPSLEPHTDKMLYATNSTAFKAACSRPRVAAAPAVVARPTVRLAPVRANDADRLGHKASEAARDAQKSVSWGLLLGTSAGLHAVLLKMECTSPLMPVWPPLSPRAHTHTAGSPHTPLPPSPPLPPSSLCHLQVSRGAEDLKDNLSDAGSKLKGDSSSAGDDLSKKADRAGKDLQNKAEDAADDSEGMLKKVGVCMWGGGAAQQCDVHA